MLLNSTFQIPNSLTHLGGIITAVFNSATYQVSVVAPSANTLYFIYLRKVSGVPALVAVTTTPATYRASFSDAILIGAYYSNGLTSPSFGSFINIEGIPESSGWNSFNIATPTGITLGAGTIVGKWIRNGSRAEIHWSFEAGAGTSYSGSNYFWDLPTNFVINRTDLTRSSATAEGVATGFINSVNYSGVTIPRLSSDAVFITGNGAASSWGNTVPAAWSTTTQLSMEIDLPITGWSNTPLKDL